MKSRYSAFVFKDSKYIINTTHPENQDYTEDIQSWSQSILKFCKTCHFEKLQILEFIDHESEAYVTFHATILCDDKDHSFCEKSKFYRVDNQWLYHSGEFL
jgi:SEC-C motif domain protein